MKSIKNVSIAIVYLLLSAVCLQFYASTWFTVSKCLKYVAENGGYEKFDVPPVNISHHPGVDTVKLFLNVKRKERQRVGLYFDDCITSFTINGEDYPGTLPLCSFYKRVDLDLSGQLRLGENVLSITLENKEYSSHLSILPLENESRQFAFLVLIGLTFFLSLSSFFKAFAGDDYRLHLSTLLIMLAMIVLRSTYVLKTDINIRGADAMGHLEYVRYLYEHWTLPGFDHGWQTYHPPIYHALAAGLVGLYSYFSPTAITHHLIIQAFSFCMSIFCLLLVWACIESSKFQAPIRLFHKNVFLLFVATNPAVVFMSAQVGTDSLFLTFCLTIYLSLIVWWGSESLRWWYSFSLASAMSLLVRFNSVVLIATGFCLMFLKCSVSLSKRLVLLCQSAALMVVLSGWFYVVRFVYEGQSHIVGNVHHLAQIASAPNTLANFTTFNFWKVLETLYNSTWDDTYRRHYFPEVLYKSFFFGEFTHDIAMRWPAVVLLCSGLVLLAFIVWNMFYALLDEKRTAYPEALVLLLSFAAIVCFRYLSPYVPSQNFRYIAFAIVPMGYMALANSYAVMRLATCATMCIISLASAVFLCAL